MGAIWPAPRKPSIQHLAERQEFDLAAGLELGERLAKDDESVRFDHRGEDPRAVAWKFARDPAPRAIRLEVGADIFAPLGLLAIVETGAHAIGPRHDLRCPGQAQDERTRQDEKGHHDGDRVARQAHEGGAADLAKRHRTTRLYGEAPEMQQAERLDRRLD